jgi:hypothetical protein
MHLVDALAVGHGFGVGVATVFVTGVILGVRDWLEGREIIRYEPNIRFHREVVRGSLGK